MGRILQITDTHIMAPGQLAYQVVDTAPFLAAAVAQIRAGADRLGDLDAVIVTGDLADRGTAEAYAHFSALIAPLEVPIWAVPGNHDRRPAMRGLTGVGTGPCTDPADPDAPIHWRLPLADFDVIGVDTCVPGASHGAVSAAALAALRTDLAASRGRPVILALHHPPFATGIAHMDKIRLLDPGPLAAVLADHDAPLRIICGHIHRHITGVLGGHVAMIAPSVAHSVMLDLRPDGPSEFNFDPPGMMLHEWRDGFVSHCVAVGDYDGPFPFWVNAKKT